MTDPAGASPTTPSATTAPSADADAVRPAPAEKDGPRVSTIVGDRLCTDCGFNLTGQPVMKEPTYGLFIARCPECGAVASLQEYPLLGKWAGRWASLAAALWLLVLLGGAAGFGMLTFGLSMGAAQVGADDYADSILLRSPAATSATGQSLGGFGGGLNRWNSIVERSWWDTQDAWAILRDAGGFRRLVASRVVGFWMGVFIAGVIVGVVASVALLHARRIRAVFLVLLPIAISVTVQVIVSTSMASNASAGLTVSARDLAVVTLGPVVFTITDGSAYLGLVLGVLIGRPVVRGLARGLLPPRMRSALAFLWLADGKAPPRA